MCLFITFHKRLKGFTMINYFNYNCITMKNFFYSWWGSIPYIQKGFKHSDLTFLYIAIKFSFLSALGTVFLYSYNNLYIPNLI